MSSNPSHQYSWRRIYDTSVTMHASGIQQWGPRAPFDLLYIVTTGGIWWDWWKPWINLTHLYPVSVFHLLSIGWECSVEEGIYETLMLLLALRKVQVQISYRPLCVFDEAMLPSARHMTSIYVQWLTLTDAASFTTAALAECPEDLSSQRSVWDFLAVSSESSCWRKMLLSFTMIWWWSVTLWFSSTVRSLQPRETSIVWCWICSSWRREEVMSVWSDEPSVGLISMTGGRWSASILPTQSCVATYPSESSFGYEWLKSIDEKASTQIC